MAHYLSGLSNFNMQIIKLKGGSLNSTCLHITDNTKFVRKTISTSANREYGYVRWYSQLKKLQRYNELFPNVVPKLLDAGFNGQEAYFDIEYIDGNDIKTLFVTDQISDINLLVNSLFSSFDLLHNKTYKPNSSSLKLYFVEEVEQKIKDALNFSEFDEFYKIGNYDYQGTRVFGVNLDKFKLLFEKPVIHESYVHGNPTLENIMYNTNTGKITFIDLYEESIVDSKFMDYSQVLQCSNSFYGIYNDNSVHINENQVYSNATIPDSLKQFNALFTKELANRCTSDDLRLINLFEATQFFRMIPFKCHAGNFDHAKFFYVHACYLVNNLL